MRSVSPPRKDRPPKPPVHTCIYDLEVSPRGYLTGSYFCVVCGERLKQSHWLRIYKAIHKKRPTLNKAA